jgi:hypothetical protein
MRKEVTYPNERPCLLSKPEAAAHCGFNISIFEVWVRRRLLPPADSTGRWPQDALSAALEQLTGEGLKNEKLATGRFAGRRIGYEPLPNVQHIVRRLVDDNARDHFYHRINRTKLPGPWGSPEFMTALIAAERLLAADRAKVANYVTNLHSSKRRRRRSTRTDDVLDAAWTGVERIAPLRKRPAILFENVSPTTPLRLSVAAALAFPDGSMSPSGLRREAARGRLEIERIAGKDYTTLAAIEHMRQLCRVEVKERGSGSAQLEEIAGGESPIQPSGSSATGSISKAWAAAETILSELSECSPPISPENSSKRRKREAPATRVKFR